MHDVEAKYNREHFYTKESTKPKVFTPRPPRDPNADWNWWTGTGPKKDFLNVTLPEESQFFLYGEDLREGVRRYEKERAGEELRKRIARWTIQFKCLNFYSMPDSILFVLRKRLHLVLTAFVGFILLNFLIV